MNRSVDGYAVVERSLGRALSTTSAVPGEAPSPADPCTRTLNWGTLPFGDERMLPAAVATWTGHAPAVTGVTDSTTLRGVGALPMGGDLVDVLAGIEVARVDDAELLDVAARWQEVVSWATAMQSRALSEIGRRRTWTEDHNAAAAEISARLRVPPGEANKHLARGAGLAEHPQVLQALEHGLIDTAKADILLRSGNPLTTQEREEAITRYLPQAPERTRRWLRDQMNAFANRLKGTTETAKHARTRRAVFLDPADNCMAWISANLPATDAAAVWDAIEQAAHALRRAPGRTRTPAQARADALVAITTGRIVVPPHPECAPQVPPVSSLSGDGVGAAGDSLVDARVAGSAAEAGAVAEASDEPVLPRTTVPAAGCTCGGCTCGGASVRVIPARPQIRVTVAATTLLGLDDAPGRLDGYGPIPADVAAQIAVDATWQRLVTDPLTGILTDYSTTTYQPGKVLRQAVITRDQTCTFPQCDRPGTWADLDHIDPYDHQLDPRTLPPGSPGQTRAANLQPLCRAHHLAKTHHDWKPARDPETGVTTWTAPTGHVYTRPATQVGYVNNDTTSLIDDTRARRAQPPLAGPFPPGRQSPGGERTTRPTTNEPRTSERAF